MASSRHGFSTGTGLITAPGSGDFPFTPLVRRNQRTRTKALGELPLQTAVAIGALGFFGHSSNPRIKPGPILWPPHQARAYRIFSHILALSVEILRVSNPMVEEVALKIDPISPAKIAFPICDQSAQAVPETWRYDKVQVVRHKQQQTDVPFLERLIVPCSV